MIDKRRDDRVRWRCRRGLLELDVLFEKFLERDYPHLTDREHAALDRLLDLPDNDLLDYCYGRAQSSDPAIQNLVEKLSK